MSPQFDCGLDRAIKEIVGGIITTFIVSAFISAGLIPSGFIGIFHVVNIAGIIVLIEKMSYWGTNYIIGWIIGVFIFMSTNLLSIFDILIYVFVPVYFIVKRVLQ